MTIEASQRASGAAGDVGGAERCISASNRIRRCLRTRIGYRQHPTTATITTCAAAATNAWDGLRTRADEGTDLGRVVGRGGLVGVAATGDDRAASRVGVVAQARQRARVV